MSRVDPLQSSSLDIYPLSSSASRHAMAVLIQLFSSCAGPYGKNHIVRNACGGHLTITSSCSRLLSSISFSRSELKMMVSAVMGHLQQRADSGLFMAHVCLQLTNSSLDMAISHSVASSTFISFVSIIVDHVKSDSCAVRVKADFSKIKPLLSYIRSILTSKAFLNIQAQDLNDLSLTVLNAYVRAISSMPTHRYSNGVFIVGQENVPIRECKCIDGLMIECPELFSSEEVLYEKIKSKSCKDSKNGECLRVALITCSMSGDVEDIVSATFEGTCQQFSDLEDSVFQKLSSLIDALERQNIAIVLCQKVIHPRLKTMLSTKGTVVMDRLGSQPIPFIRDLTGCVPITSPLLNIEGQTHHLGKVTSVSLLKEKQKSYLCLKNSDASVVTLVVCSDWEERLSELKACVNTCLKGLESLAREPWLLMGGGCWQMYCCEILKEKVLSTLPEMCQKLSCSESTLRQLLTVFRSCLLKWSLGLKHNLEHVSFDPSSCHCWRVGKNIQLSPLDNGMKTCGCGFKAMLLEHLENLDVIVPRDDDFGVSSNEVGSLCESYAKDVCDYDKIVLDSLPACMEALQKGVLTSGLLLSIGQLICDRN